MASDQEQPRYPSEFTPDEERRIERLVDNSVFSRYEAEIAVTGLDHERVPFAKPHGPERHVSHRGGRSYAETGESELDPHWNPHYEAPDDTEKNRRAEVLAGRGHQAAAAVGALAAHNSVMKATAGESVSYQLARERAAQEKRSRRLNNH